MKNLVTITCFMLAFVICRGQINCIPITSKLFLAEGKKQLTFKAATTGQQFHFTIANQTVEQLSENGFVNINGQVTQFVLLQPTGIKVPPNGRSEAEQRELLKAYTKYERDYFTNELKIEVINPNDQWVPIGNRKWFIWYFKVGQLPENLKNKFDIQLYASTLEGNTILTLNMPIEQQGDFRKSAMIMNALMEGMTVEMKK